MENKIERFYRIGNLGIQYTGPDFEEMEYLKVFRENKNSEIVGNCGAANTSSSTSSMDSDIQLDIENQDPDMSYNTRFFIKMLNLPAKVLEYDAVFLHASYIIWHGKAILFTAPKQTGKSTQAALWEKYEGAEIINGDRALIRRYPEQKQTESLSPERWIVYSSPYCGTSKICKNKSAELAAIVILGQAPANEIRSAKIGERVQAMLDGCSYDTSDRRQVQKVMDLTMNLAQEVPFIILNCLPDQSAADTLEEYLCRMKIIL